MKLILTRHGETEENINGIVQGHLPGILSKKGIKQAKKLAKRLKNEKIDAIYSSDLARASDTAKAISQFHTNTPIYFSKQLRERSAGSLEGKKISDVNWGKQTKELEDFKSLLKRATKFIDKAYKKHKNQTILVVGHGGINCNILSLFSTMKPGQIFDTDHPKNTSVYIIDFNEDGKGKITLNNCIKHLTKELK